MLPPDAERRLAAIDPQPVFHNDGAGVTLAMFAASSGCLVGLLIGVLIGWVTA